MATSSVGSTTSTASTSGSTSSSLSSQNLQLNSSDFIQLLITQLQNQDPMNPTSNADLAQQVSAIGQLQSTDTLQTTVQSMMLQSQIGSASNMIGKTVQGLDDQQQTVTGTVSGVHIQSNTAYLELNNGDQLQLSNVTDVANTD